MQKRIVVVKVQVNTIQATVARAQQVVQVLHVPIRQRVSIGTVITGQRARQDVAKQRVLIQQPDIIGRATAVQVQADVPIHNVRVNQRGNTIQVTVEQVQQAAAKRHAAVQELEPDITGIQITGLTVQPDVLMHNVLIQRQVNTLQATAARVRQVVHKAIVPIRQRVNIG